MRRPALFLAWVLVAVALRGGAEAQDSTNPAAPNSYLENLAVTDGNNSIVETLAMGGTATGTLDYYDFQVFGFTIPEREEDGLGFPDVVLSLEVTNDEVGGNADLFCLPHIQVNGRTSMPWRRQFRWHSNHTQGVDHIFISSNDSIYGEAVSTNFTREEGHTTTVSFVCSVWGASIIPTDFHLDLDVDYTQRTLVPAEVDAVQSIFDKCCGVTGCPRWFRLSQAVVGWNASSGLPVLDLCHLNVYGNLCDNTGRLVKLNMNLFDMECEVPVEELTVMSRLRKISLEYNDLTGDIGVVAEVLKQLEVLNRFSVAGNRLDGTLSDDPVCELATGGMLEYLNLGGNQVVGPLPDCFLGENSTLTEIFLDGNNLGSTIPSAIASDSGIKILSLFSAGLTGSIPESMANMERLQSVDVGNNSLTGTIPKVLGGLPYLVAVNAPHNRLSGAVPDSLLTGKLMRHIELDYNELSELPGAWNTEKAAGSDVRTVYMSHNNFTGPVPAAVLTGNISTLDLSFNGFSGELPVFDEMLLRAFFVDIQANKLSGAIPDGWENIGMIVGGPQFDYTPQSVLRLQDNELSGDMPPFLLVQNDASSGEDHIVLNITGNNLECVDEAVARDLFHIVLGLEQCEPEPEPEPEPVASPEETAIEAPEADGNKTEEIPRTTPVESPETTPPQSPEMPPEAPEETVMSTEAPSVAASSSVGGEEAGSRVEISGNADGGGSSAASSAGIAIGVVAAAVVAIAVIMVLVIRRRRLQNRRAVADDAADVEGGKAAVSHKFEKFNDDEGQAVQMFAGASS